MKLWSQFYSRATYHFTNHKVELLFNVWIMQHNFQTPCFHLSVWHMRYAIRSSVQCTTIASNRLEPTLLAIKTQYTYSLVSKLWNSLKIWAQSCRHSYSSWIPLSNGPHGRTSRTHLQMMEKKIHSMPDSISEITFYNFAANFIISSYTRGIHLGWVCDSGN